MKSAEPTQAFDTGAMSSRPRGNATRLADLAALLSEMRRAGVKPTPAAIDQALQKRGFSVPDSRPERDGKIVRLSDAADIPHGDALSDRSQKYESELEAARREIAELQQELREFRKAMPEVLRRESELLHQLDMISGGDGSNVVARAESPQPATDFESQLHEALEREAALRQQLEKIESRAAEETSLASDLEQQREREAALVEKLEAAASRAQLVDQLEAELRELQSALTNFQEREAEWAALEEREAEALRRAESLAKKADASELALKDSRMRQNRIEGELAELHHNLREAHTKGSPAQQAKLADATRELEEARIEAALKATEAEKLRERADQAEAAITEGREHEAELLARLEDAALRASKAEEHLAGRLAEKSEQTGPLRAQLLQALDGVATMLPAEASPAALPEAETAEALLAHLHGEITRAQEYQNFLKQQLARPKREAGGSEGGIKVHIESESHGKYLAEIIEGELHRQGGVLSELARREADLRVQLEKAKPMSVRAQTIESELTGALAYREEVQQRVAAVTRVLDETIASLRAQAAKAG
jgi:myosin heavy subunit